METVSAGSADYSKGNRPLRWSGLWLRSLSSVLVVAGASVLVYVPAPMLIAALLALAGLTVREMYSLLGGRGVVPPWGAGVALTAALVLSAAGGRLSMLWLAASLAVLCTAIRLVIQRSRSALWRRPEGEEDGGVRVGAASRRFWIYTVAGALYVGVPLAHLGLLRSLPQGVAWLLLCFFCTWATDTGAYIVGSLLGRRKLAPTISPGKTVEGALGGVAVTVLTGLVVGWVVGVPLPWWGVALAAVALSLFAQAGDLVESYLKRRAGVKDSGDLLPGHGGLLDRLDGFLWVVPATYYVALMAAG